jgi:hypothetical protein
MSPWERSSSVKDYLDPVAPGLAPLISDGSLRSVSLMAEELPGSLAHSTFGLECPLGGKTGRVDLLLCATAASGGRGALLTLVSSTSGEQWRGIGNFARAWADPSSLLHANADRVWLEFDVPAVHSGLSVPSFFFAPRTPRSTEPDLLVAAAGIELLRAERTSGPLSTRLTACFEALPPDAFVFQVGIMLSRPPGAVRLCIYGLGPAEMVEYLGRLDWGGPGEELKRTLETLSALTSFVCLDLDVDSRGVRKRLGLECYCFAPDQPLREVDWSPFLDHLVSSRVCSPEERAALGGLTESVRSPGEAWPVELLRASSFLGGRISSHLVRALHHVKVSFVPSQHSVAKAYVAIWHEWR